MTTYSVGTTIASTSSRFLEASEASIMQNLVTDALNQIVTDDQELVVALNISGAGNGHAFVVELVQADNAGGGDPLDETARIACYLAASADELPAARNAALAYLASLPPPGDGDVLTLVDEQMAGATNGTRFMGIIITDWVSPD